MAAIVVQDLFSLDVGTSVQVRKYKLLVATAAVAGFCWIKRFLPAVGKAPFLRIGRELSSNLTSTNEAVSAHHAILPTAVFPNHVHLKTTLLHPMRYSLFWSISVSCEFGPQTGVKWV